MVAVRNMATNRYQVDMPFFLTGSTALFWMVLTNLP